MNGPTIATGYREVGIKTHRVKYDHANVLILQNEEVRYVYRTGNRWLSVFVFVWLQILLFKL